MDWFKIIAVGYIILSIVAMVVYLGKPEFYNFCLMAEIGILFLLSKD